MLLDARRFACGEATTGDETYAWSLRGLRDPDAARLCRTSGRTSAVIVTPGVDVTVALRVSGPAGEQEATLAISVADTRDGILRDIDVDDVIDAIRDATGSDPCALVKKPADGDGDGRSDPHDIDDAVTAAANYLCHGNRDMSRPDGWYDALYSYNPRDDYVKKVFDRADEYGRKSTA